MFLYGWSGGLVFYFFKAVLILDIYSLQAEMFLFLIIDFILFFVKQCPVRLTLHSSPPLN